MSSMPSTPLWFRIYTGLVIAVTVVLIWWGAAVTTENVGMAVPDWPLSFGTLNPKGWWAVEALRLEHGHRLIATLVGLMTLGLCAAAWLGTRSKPVRILSTLAVFAVILQGVLGGMRVLHISDTFGIVHGCLGQSFFCLLLLTLAASGNWDRRPIVDERAMAGFRGFSALLFAGVFLQLVFGAVLRHTQRFHLADDAVFTTGGGFFPGFGEADLLVLFMHKWWAVAVLLMAVGFAVVVFRQGVPRLSRWVGLVLVLILAQVALGVSVIVTGKTFWVTNFHVLNGLAILGTSFLLMVHSWRSQPGSILLAKEPLPA